jgi:SNF2 family DNA or RNA helicase
MKPETMMTKTLLPHQIETAEFLAAREFAGCFSGMGSGKTLSALAAVAETGLLELRYNAVLIVAPPIALSMWKAEAEARFPDASAQIIKTGATKIDPDADFLICSYEIATKRAADFSPLVLICDEAHALKSSTSKRTKAILGKGGIAGRAQHAWMLTGTPATRYADDYYPFLCRADIAGVRKRCGGTSLERFRLKYCITQRRTFGNSRFAKPVTVAVGSRNLSDLREWIYGEGLAIRHELADVWKNMPPITRQAYEITPRFSSEIRAMMREFENKSISELQADLQKSEPALATIMRELGMGKSEEGAGFIRGLVEDKSTEGGILVGAWHTDVIDALAQRLGDLRVGVIDGRTTQARRDELQDKFNGGGLDVLIGQIAAMGVSLNLQQGGSTIVTVEENWSPAVMDQFYARLHRMGQRDHVNVINLRTDTKIEAALVRIAANKTAEHRRVNAQ